jgi:hypothetical protein
LNTVMKSQLFLCLELSFPIWRGLFGSFL